MSKESEPQMGKAAIFGEKKFRQPANMLTGKQADVLVFLWNFYEANDQIPPYDVICAHFGFASVNAAHDHLLALARKGWIAKNIVGKWKFTDVSREALR